MTHTNPHADPPLVAVSCYSATARPEQVGATVRLLLEGHDPHLLPGHRVARVTHQVCPLPPQHDKAGTHLHVSVLVTSEPETSTDLVEVAPHAAFHLFDVQEHRR